MLTVTRAVVTRVMIAVSLTKIYSDTEVEYASKVVNHSRTCKL